MPSANDWTQYHNLLGLNSFARRVDILRRQYLNHRFDRRSQLSALSDEVLGRIYAHEVTFPPRRYLMQPGTQTIDGLFFLVSLARFIAATSIFEIGTYTGLTAWTMSRNLPNAEVHTLDIPMGSTPSWELEMDDVHRGQKDALLYSELPHSGRITQHWEDSATFDFSPWSQSVDVVYIDGAHSEPYVRSDTRNAYSMLSERGVIVWDDYWRLSRGVVAVLHEQARKSKLYRVPGTRLVIYLSPGVVQNFFRQ